MPYFDHNATTPLSSLARDAWLEAQGGAWYNPSSLYPEAARVDHELEGCRVRIADRLDCDPERVVFTSGATEANNGLFRSVGHHHQGSRILTGATEHPSVLEPSRAVFGEEAVRLGVDSEGVIDLADLEGHLAGAERPALVSVMAANNETGTLQPWAEVAERSTAAGVPFHCDAAQWLGKLPAKGLGKCDYLTASAHKFGGPKGVGFLLVPEDDGILRLAQGGPQEAGRRAGTEDYPSIVAMVAALEEAEARRPDSSLRDAFEERILVALPGCRIVGGGAQRLWNTSMVCLPMGKNLRWLTRLARRGFQVSTGSACSAGKGRPSPVLAAMGQDPEAMGLVLRFSSGHETTEDHWTGLLEALVEVGEELPR